MSKRLKPSSVVVAGSIALVAIATVITVDVYKKAESQSESGDTASEIDFEVRIPDSVITKTESNGEQPKNPSTPSNPSNPTESSLDGKIEIIRIKGTTSEELTLLKPGDKRDLSAHVDLIGPKNRTVKYNFYIEVTFEKEDFSFDDVIMIYNSSDVRYSDSTGYTISKNASQYEFLKVQEEITQVYKKVFTVQEGEIATFDSSGNLTVYSPELSMLVSNRFNQNLPNFNIKFIWSIAEIQ